MKNEQNFEQNQTLESHLLNKIKGLFERVGISDYSYEEKSDGIHFIIKTPPEHIEERRRQMTTLSGGLEPTQFMKDKIIPLRKLLLKEGGLKFHFVSGISPLAGYLEIVISEK